MARVGVLLALLAAAWWVAVPDLSGVARPNANDNAAIATLKILHEAQSQVRASCAIDCDGDRVGEYAFFAELAAAVRLRTNEGAALGAPLQPPVMSQAFGKVKNGCVQRSGYLFQLFLAGPNGTWIPEASTGGAPMAVDSQCAERGWLCYAWPAIPGNSGIRAFCIDQEGDVRACNMDAEVYSHECAPTAGVAGFRLEGGVWVRAINEVDSRGNTWSVVR